MGINQARTFVLYQKKGVRSMRAGNTVSSSFVKGQQHRVRGNFSVGYVKLLDNGTLELYSGCHSEKRIAPKK